MTDRAAALVDQAKDWGGLCGGFITGDEGASLTVPLRAHVAWEEDADAFADLFAEDGSMLVSDSQPRGREAVRVCSSSATASGSCCPTRPARSRAERHGCRGPAVRGGPAGTGELPSAHINCRELTHRHF